MPSELKMKNYVVGIIGGIVGALIVIGFLVIDTSDFTNYFEHQSFQQEKKKVCGEGASITDEFGRHCCTSGFTLSGGCTADFIRP